jgi:hypothetical protein
VHFSEASMGASPELSGILRCRASLITPVVPRGAIRLGKGVAVNAACACGGVTPAGGVAGARAA